MQTYADEGLYERLRILDQTAATKKRVLLLCSGLVVILGMTIVGLLYVASLPRYIPYYVEIDRSSGDVRVVGTTPQTVTLPELAVKHMVARFVEQLRGIPTDQEILKRDWRRASHQVSPEGRTMLAQYEATFQPLLQVEPVFVQVVSVLQETEMTWNARWVESRYSVKMELKETATYRGVFTLVKKVPQTDDERKDAPLGLFIHNWHWTRE